MDYICLTYFLSKFLKTKKAALLCLPPFYKNKRVLKIKLQSYDLTYPKNTLKRIVKKITLIVNEKVEGLILKTILKQFDLIIAVSTAIIEEMGDEWKKRIHVLNPNTSYEHMKVNIKTKKKHSADYKYDAIFYARLIPEKGIFDIPLIWKKVVEKGLKAKLAIVGEFSKKEVKETFFKLINKLSLNKYIEYLGWQPHEKIKNLLEKSKIVIYPSYLDSISMVIIESLAHNKIVIAYDIPAVKHNYPIKEVVKVKTGDYNEMAEKIIDILLNEKYKTTISRKFLEKFKSWDKVVENEVKILQKVL